MDHTSFLPDLHIVCMGVHFYMEVCGRISELQNQVGPRKTTMESQVVP